MLQWDTIDKILELFGFYETFREMIKACISSTSFSSMVEGSPSSVFHSHKWSESRGSYVFAPLGSSD